MASCLFDYNLSNQGPAQSTDATGNAVTAQHMMARTQRDLRLLLWHDPETMASMMKVTPL